MAFTELPYIMNICISSRHSLRVHGCMVPMQTHKWGTVLWESWWKCHGEFFLEVLYVSKESMVQVLTIVVVVVHVFPNFSPCIAQILSAYVWHINFPFVVLIVLMCPITCVPLNFIPYAFAL